MRTKSPLILLKQLVDIKAQLEAASLKDPSFRDFYYSVNRYPFRILGYTEPCQGVFKTYQEWEARYHPKPLER